MENVNNSENAGKSSETTLEDLVFSKSEIVSSKSFFGIVIASVFVIIIGLIWGIADLIQPEGKWEMFLQLPLYSQVFIIALLTLFLLFVGIFLTVFYRRGRQWLLDGLYGNKPFREETREEFLPAKIIAGGLLISIAIVVIGFTIAFIQEYLIGIDSSGFIGEINIQSGGLRTLLIGIFIQIIVWLVIGFMYLWQNGYYFVMNYILNYNKKVGETGYNEKQRTIARVFFVITIFAIILIVLGIVYSIMDAVQPTGKWESFKTYSFGLQFAIIGTFAAGLFTLLVVSMMLYKRGMLVIMNALFLNLNKELAKDEKTTIAKALTWGILIAIFAIFISLISYLISVGFEVGGFNIFNLGSLSGGITVLLVGLFILLFEVLILLFTYIYKNGYSVMVEQVIKIQDNFEKWMFEKQEAEKKKKQAKLEIPNRNDYDVPETNNSEEL